MKHWDELLGKRLRGYRGADVPGQADDLWANIDAALSVPSGRPTPWSRQTPFRLALAGSIAAAIVMGLMVRQADPTISPAPTLDTQQSEVEAPPALQADPSDIAATPETNSAAAPSDASSSAAPNAPEFGRINPTAPPVSETAVNQVTTPQEPSPHITATSSQGSTAGNAATPTSAITTSIEAAAATSPVIAPSVSTDNSSASADIQEAPGVTTADRDSEDTAPPSLRRLTLRTASPILSASNAPLLFGHAEDIPEHTTFAIRAFAGPTWSHFSVVDNPEQSAYFHADNSAGGGLMFEFNGAQAWSIGLAWTDFVHNLQYTETTETEISAPGVVSVVVDISTGDTLSINEGPLAGVEERSRYVDHHNRLQAFSIPLEWRQVRSLGQLQYGLGLGAMLQIRSGASGSIINAEGLVVRYSDGHLSRGRLTVVPMARLFAGLRFAPAWRMDLGVAAGVQRHASRSAADSPASAPPTWQGRLVHSQVQVGLSRFLTRIK